MIRTKQQYDRVFDAVVLEDREQMVALGQGEAPVEAVLLNDTLYVASLAASQKIWTPVNRDALADGVSPPKGLSAVVKAAPPEKVSLSPTLPTMPFESLERWHVNVRASPPPAIFADLNYVGPEFNSWLTENPHIWYPVESYDDASATLTPSTSATYVFDKAATTSDLLRPIESASYIKFSAYGPAPSKTHHTVEASTLMQAPHEGLLAAQLERHRFPLMQRVDPRSGHPVLSSQKGSILRKTFLGRLLVDAKSGEFVLPGTPGAMYMRDYDKSLGPNSHSKRQNSENSFTPALKPLSKVQIYQRRRVDPETGMSPLDPNTPTISFREYYESQLVHPETGKNVTSETEGAIPRRLWSSRNRVPQPPRPTRRSLNR